MTDEPMKHDPYARECVVTGIPAEDLHDDPCPACRAMSALMDLDPDYGPAVDGRPYIGPDRRSPGLPACCVASGVGVCDVHGRPTP